MVGLVVIVSTARADTTYATPSDDDPDLRSDPDGVPLNVTQNRFQRATPEQIAADRKARQAAALDKDWMLRAYEKQLQTHAETSTAMDRSANPYQEISANQDLTDYHNDSANDEPLFRTKDSAAHGASALRPGSNPPLLKSAAFGSSFLTPLVTPLGATDAAGIKNFYASLPDASVAPFNGSTPAPELHARTSIIPDPTDNDIETPGMIAAKKDPLTDPATLDTEIDSLPGESLAHARAHQDNSESLLQLPIVMDAEQLHREQASYLAPPTARPLGPNQTTAATPAKPTVAPLENLHEPVPISQMPVINPVRAPIANPYDILNR